MKYVDITASCEMYSKQNWIYRVKCVELCPPNSNSAALDRQVALSDHSNTAWRARD